VAASDKSPEPCAHCGGEGVLRWSQPVPGPDGGVRMRVRGHADAANDIGGDFIKRFIADQR
jgi:hypothetical protein